MSCVVDDPGHGVWLGIKPGEDAFDAELVVDEGGEEIVGQG